MSRFALHSPLGSDDHEGPYHDQDTGFVNCSGGGQLPPPPDLYPPVFHKVESSEVASSLSGFGNAPVPLAGRASSPGNGIPQDPQVAALQWLPLNPPEPPRITHQFPNSCCWMQGCSPPSSHLQFTSAPPPRRNSPHTSNCQCRPPRSAGMVSGARLRG